jgi:hypothetical protein
VSAARLAGESSDGHAAHVGRSQNGLAAVDARSSSVHEERSSGGGNVTGRGATSRQP